MLLNTIDEVKVVANISDATEMGRLSTHLANAEITYIQPLLGNDMYAALLAYHDDPDSYKITDITQYDADFITGSGSASTDDSGSGDIEANPSDLSHAILLYHTQRTIVFLAYWKGFESLNSTISDMGFRRLESEGMKSMYKYQEDNLRKFFFETGINGLDVILEVLEYRIQYFSAYKAQMYKHKGRIIPDTKTFSNHYFINNSRIVFDRLRQHMKAVEELKLTPIVGADNMQFILTEIGKEAPDARVTAILPYLRDVVAYFSATMLMEESGAELTERGLYLFGIKSMTNSDLWVNTDEARVTYLINRNNKIGNEYIERLRVYLNQHSSEWNDYNNPRSRIPNRDNSGKRTFFA